MSDSEFRYRNGSQQLLLRVQRALSVEPLTPKSVEQVVAMVDAQAGRDAVFRALANLEHGGWAEKTAGGWRVAPDATLLAERVRVAIADLHRTYLGGTP